MEGQSGTSSLLFDAHSGPKTTKLGLGHICWNSDGSEPLSMPFHSLRNVIPPTWHTTEVIYPGHMQWKGSRAHPHCSLMSTLAPKPQNWDSVIYVRIWMARNRYPCHFTNSGMSSHPPGILLRSSTQVICSGRAIRHIHIALWHPLQPKIGTRTNKSEC